MDAAEIIVLLVQAILVPVGLVLKVGLLYGLYRLLSAPLRRRERERCLLDVLETAMARGQSPEQALADIARRRDPVFRGRLRRLANELAEGKRLSEALRSCYGFVSPKLVTVLQAGELTGDMRRVLPACRAMLGPATSHTTAAANYLLVVPLLLGPGLVVLPFLGLFILPKFKEIFSDLVESALPAATAFLFANSFYLSAVCGLLGFGVVVLAVGYAAGPWLRGACGGALRRGVDAVLGCLPWRRWRVQRDFSQMLATLLDANAPEYEAVRWAAQSTDNAAFRARAERALAQLRDGVPLTAAVAALDDTGELRWRLANALQGGRGFLDALRGWHESLEARAYRAEQMAAQLVTTGLVLLNGAFVGLIAIAVFSALVEIPTRLMLW